jgi:hypothetical protein
MAELCASRGFVPTGGVGLKGLHVASEVEAAIVSTKAHFVLSFDGPEAVEVQISSEGVDAAVVGFVLVIDGQRTIRGVVKDKRAAQVGLCLVAREVLLTAPFEGHLR